MVYVTLSLAFHEYNNALLMISQSCCRHGREFCWNAFASQCHDHSASAWPGEPLRFHRGESEVAALLVLIEVSLAAKQQAAAEMRLPLRCNNLLVGWLVPKSHICCKRSSPHRGSSSSDGGGGGGRSNIVGFLLINAT